MVIADSMTMAASVFMGPCSNAIVVAVLFGT
jgi:hypothetical protein